MSILEIIKKIPLALTNLGIGEGQQRMLLENYITNLIITASKDIRSLSDEEYKELLKKI